MSFTQAVSSGLGNYATFSGRASRSAYWWWVLFTVVVQWVTSFVDAALFGTFSFVEVDGAIYGGVTSVFTPITTLVGLALLIPSIAVAVRRFHDLGRSGWWLLLAFTGIGAVVIFFWFMVRGTHGPNHFGPDPLEL